MTIKVNYIDKGRGVEILASGLVTGKELISAQAEIYAADKLSNQCYHIIDKSQCTEYNVTAADIETVAQLDRKAAQVNSALIMAIVESSTLEYSLSELWQAYVEPFIQHSQSFSNRMDAEQWIRDTLEEKSRSSI